MRVCPKCGFIDPPEWKHCKWSYHVDGITRENFSLLYSELAKNLKRGGDITEDKDFVYRLTKTELVVERKSKIDALYVKNPKNPMSGELYEKGSRQNKNPLLIKEPHDSRAYWRKWHPSQTKLLKATK